MSFDFLKELLNEETTPHDRYLSMGDESQIGTAGSFNTKIMGLDVTITFNENGEIVDVDIDNTLNYNRDLIGDLHTFVYDGGLGYTELDVNFREGMSNLAFQRPRQMGTVLADSIDRLKESGVEFTELTEKLWNEVWSSSFFEIPLVPNYDENALLVVPLKEDGNEIISDIYFSAINKEAEDFFTMALYNDVNGVTNANLGVHRSSLAGRVKVRNVIRVNDLQL